MTRDEREALSQRICNFYCDSANKSVKTTVNYFIKQNIPRRTIYYILNKYLKYGITKNRPRSGRPLKLSDKKLKDIVKSVNNRTDVSQRELAKDSHVHHSTISRNLRRRTSIRIRKRRMASKSVQERLNEKNVPFVIRKDNPPNVPQARPIETIWSLLEQKVYENNWQANNIDALAQKIKKNQKNLI